MNVIQVDFSQSAQHLRLARAFSRLTGIELRRLIATSSGSPRSSN